MPLLVFRNLESLLLLTPKYTISVRPPGSRPMVSNRAVINMYAALSIDPCDLNFYIHSVPVVYKVSTLNYED